MSGEMFEGKRPGMEKDRIREQVWQNLRSLARPDSRFDLDFGSFIPDFEGSRQALTRLLELELYQNSNLIFITPDNCLEDLRAQVIRDSRLQIVPTYGIRRGMVLLEREKVPLGLEEFAATLDGMERFGRNLTLTEIQRLGQIDFLITGASAIDLNGVRYGKGHGYFDLEWAMMHEIGVVDEGTPVIAFVHDVQVVDTFLSPKPYDTIANLVITPTRIIQVEQHHEKPGGVHWDMLDPGMLGEIPLLSDLEQLKK